MVMPIKLIRSGNDVPGLLLDGQIGIIPTDTLYGIVACATNKQAVRRLYDLKNRQDKPGTLIAASVSQLVEIGIPGRYLKPIAHFWPNPISIVVPTSPGLAYLDLGRFTLAMRIPKNVKLTTLLNKTGPLLTTSANKPGKTPVTNIAEAQKVFNEQVDFYVDGGDLSGQLPSTIIRVVDDAVEVLREGAVKVDEERGEIIT